MGVVYKLKDEIVQFILKQKQETPNISCRKLVNIIQETFQVSVSKSSINIIIKDANLSNPVGRTPLQAKKFKIPAVKKAELLEKTQPTLKDVLTGPSPETVQPPVSVPPPAPPVVQPQPISDPVAPPVPEPPPAVEPPSAAIPESLQRKFEALEKLIEPPSIEEPVAPSLPPVEEIPPQIPEPPAMLPPVEEKPVEEPASPQPLQVEPPVVMPAPVIEEADVESPADEPRLSLLPDPIAQPPQQEISAPSLVETPQPVPAQPAAMEDPAQRIEVPKIGNIFLRAAAWDLSRRPLLENFLKRTGLSDEEIRIVDALLCFNDPVFDDPAKALDAEHAWLWMASGYEVLPASESLQQLMQRLNEITIDAFDFFLEIGYLFLPAAEIKVYLEDSSVISLDPRMTQFLDGKAAECPVDRSVEEISQFISQRQKQAVLWCPASPAALNELKNFTAACECAVNKTIKSIVLYDASDKVIAQFENILNFERNFVVMLKTSREQFQQLFGFAPEFTSDKTIQHNNQTMYWFDHNLETGSQKALSLRIFSEAVEAKEFMILCLTGLEAQNIGLYMNNIYIISQTIKNEQFMNNLGAQPDLTGQKPLIEGLRYLKQKIAGYSLRLFGINVDREQLFVNICNLNGYINIDKKSVSVGVKTVNEVLPEGLEECIRVLNAYKIINYDGKPLKAGIKYNI